MPLTQTVNANQELSGRLGLKVSRPEDREWAKKRAIRRWRWRHFFAQRWRELPLELMLWTCRHVLCPLIPGLNMPMHGRLYAKVWRTTEKGLAVGRTITDEDGQVAFEFDGPFPSFNGRPTFVMIAIEEAERRGLVECWDHGHVGVHLVVTAGKNYVAACFDNTNEPENLKYHGYGTGTGAAAAGDTALGTELTTQYATDSTRPTGSQAHSTNTYTTVATLSPDSGGTIAVTEWGLFSASSSTTLFDRQVFSAVNLVAGSDSLQTTYVLTLS